MRVTGVLTARGYNIESLTVARTLDPELSRMSIVVDIEPAQRAQLIKQMNKLINVLQASDFSESPGGSARTGAAAGARRHAESRGDPEGSRDFRRTRRGFVAGGFRPRSHRRSGEAERVHRRDARYGEIEVTRSGMVAVSLDSKKTAAGPARTKGPKREERESSMHQWLRDFTKKTAIYRA